MMKLRTTLRDIYFLEDLRDLLKAGMTLTEALSHFGDGINKSKLKYLATFPSEQGKPLSEIWSGHIPPMYRLVLLSGEESGHLEAALSSLIRRFWEEHSWKKSLWKLAAYPSFLFVMTLFVNLVTVRFVLPEFQRMNFALSTSHWARSSPLLKISEWFPGVSALALVLIFLLLSSAALYYRFGRRDIVQSLKNFPLRTFLLNHQSRVMAELLSTLLSAGFPIVESLYYIDEIGGPVWLSTRAVDIAKRILAGQTLEEAVGSSFGTHMTRMIALAERTGDLAETFRRSEKFYQEKIHRDLERTFQWMEPALTGFIGLSVSATIFTVYAPMYQMIQEISVQIPK